MLETVQRGFLAAKNRLTGDSVPAEAIQSAIKDIRRALLEADVEIGVVRRFLGRVETRARGELTSGEGVVRVAGALEKVTPYHRFAAICQDELEELLGGDTPDLQFAPMGVTVIMVVGLQGSGKTTSAAKIARWLQEDQGRKPMLVAADLQRPAATEQLQRLGQKVGVPVFTAASNEDTPYEVCARALAQARQKKRDTVILDTAGRLAIDSELMSELSEIRKRTQPQETLLVVDSMIGQDAVRTAAAFDETISLTGFVLTKLDGDARGGVALSLREITSKPIQFLATGEGPTALERFRAEGLASRILGMGDVVSLVEEFERRVDADKAEADTERMLRGQFDMGDFVEQIQMLREMGSFDELLEKMPTMQPGMQPSEAELGRIVAVHNSMTPLERRRPALLKVPSRAARVANGAGVKAEQVEIVLQKFDAMRRMMIQLGEDPSMLARIPGFGQLAKVRKLRGLDLTDVFGDYFEAPEDDVDLFATEAPATESKNKYFSDMPKPKGAPSKARNKRKQKMARKARKKNRR